MKTILKFIALMATFVVVPFLAADQALWDGWRGPDRDANVPDFEPPENWPDDLEKMWEVEVGGGYATPLIVGDRIYQHARIGRDEVLTCLDAETGKEQWQVKTPIAFEPGRGGQSHGPGPKSTPVYDEGRVFTLSITGTLTAWSATDGERLWQRDFRESLAETYPYWGIATSPVIENGRLYAHVGSCDAGALFCLDPATGKDIWVQDKHANCYSSPIIATVDGVRQFVEFNHFGLCGLDLETGEILWEYEFPHRGNTQNTPTPVYHQGRFIVGAEDRGMFAVRVKREGNLWEAERDWKHRDVSLDMASPTAVDGVVYGFSHFKFGQLFALDAETGKVLWLGPPRGGKNAAIVALPNQLLALRDRGELHVLRSSRKKLDIIRTFMVGDRGTWTAPAVYEDSVLIKDGESLARWQIPKR